MAREPRAQQWPPYPHIPIYLETTDNDGIARSFRSISPLEPRPHSDSRTESHSIQYLAAASTQFTKVSTNVSPVSPATQFTNLSPIWPLPDPLPIPPPDIVQKDRRRPALRFFPTARPRVQMEQSASSEKTNPTFVRPHSSRKSKVGLGIGDFQSTHSPNSPLPPDLEHGNRNSNIAQRIEERIWRYNRSGNVAKRWLLEIISWCVSALSMAVIIGVLIYYRDKKLPRWPGGLTLNAFISVLSKISGAALILPVSEALGQLKWSWFQGNSKTMWDFEIFDNASRGPWGSFLLLIRTKGKALAAIGALITLFSLALDPFFQQVVDFPERWAFNGTSSIPRVIQYKSVIAPQFQAGIQLAVNDQTIAMVTESYFYDNGTQPVPFGNGTRADIPLSCPSSNCTWPAYETLAVCSQCTEVSNLLTYGCYTTKMDWISTQEGFTANSTMGKACGWFVNATSNNPVLMSGYRIDSNDKHGEALLTRIMPLTTNPLREALFDGSINFKHIRNPIMDAIIVGSANASSSVYAGEKPTAHECVINWCVKTIKSSYYSGTYEEETLDTYMNTTKGSFPWSTTTVTGAAINATFQYYLLDSYVSITAPLNGKTASWYGVSNDTAFNMIFSFDDIAPSFVTVADPTASPFMRFKVQKKAPQTRSLLENPWMLPNNVTHHMERLSTALTNAIRSSDSHEMIDGQAYDRENYVSVRWVWLTLPLGLLFSTALFLAATIIKTSRERERVGIWKTSALATLLYGLPDHYQGRLANRDSISTPRAKAKKLKVKLTATKGWRISGNLFSPMTPTSSIKKEQAPPGWI